MDFNVRPTRPNHYTKMMSNGFVFPSIIQAVDASTVRDICMEYIYDKCPAVAAVGKSKFSPRNNERNLRMSLIWLHIEDDSIYIRPKKDRVANSPLDTSLCSYL